jgi:hypothetical protein
MLFTQQIKDNWIQNLKSGKYVQGAGRLYNSVDNSYCCIGVLGDCTPGLDNSYVTGKESPYDFLEKTIGNKLTENLYFTNDRSYDPEHPDYSNVLSLIEQLPVQEDEK